MTLEKADEISAAYAGKHGTMAELGDDFGVTASTIHRVVHGPGNEATRLHTAQNPARGDAL
ncbi:hypothetical protein [Bradyrhizobium yuanmingense]|uniref:hypothetical protein n=1 Tax=Bradyrhizobium yuanmingense TaxID=108015 RepID=UPI00114C9B29|nr:hypothetical protein [Bradyrhizobium yuanmingense]MCA1530762.1 hypothetical protein [Bradyrhizobium yuanmingense]